MNNIYNNIDYIPNLKFFELYCNTYDIIENLYKKFISKLISLKLDELYLSINYKRKKERKIKIKEEEEEENEDEDKDEDDNLNDDYSESDNKSENEAYSKKELKELCPTINFNNYKNICIRKFYKRNYEIKNNFKITDFFKSI